MFEGILESPKPAPHLHVPTKFLHELADERGLDGFSGFQPSAGHSPDGLMNFALQKNLALANVNAAGPGTHRRP